MRWEMNLWIQSALLAAGILIVVPLVASLLGFGFLREYVALFRQLMANHRFREVTGFIGLGFGLFQLLLSARKRTTLSFHLSYPRWRSIHVLAGVISLGVIVVHTGGRWGHNLNGLLLSAFTLTVFSALVGKVLEARLFERMRRKGRRDQLSKAHIPAPLRFALGATRLNRLRAVWLGLHIGLTSLFFSLLAFHILSVYYF
jgi:hypothetical protein